MHPMRLVAICIVVKRCLVYQFRWFQDRQLVETQSFLDIETSLAIRADSAIQAIQEHLDLLLGLDPFFYLATGQVQLVPKVG